MTIELPLEDPSSGRYGVQGQPFPALAVSQVPSAQNHHHAHVAYFGVAGLKCALRPPELSGAGAGACRPPGEEVGPPCTPEGCTRTVWGRGRWRS